MIIPFIRSLYHPQDIEGAEGATPLDDQELHAEIRRNCIAAQVFHLMKSSGEGAQRSPAFQQFIYQTYESSFLQSLLIKRETELLLKEFDAQGVPVIPLKGTMLAERYYGHYAARGTSDIDLLIHPEHMEAAVKCIHHRGFIEASQENPVHYHHEWFKQTGGLPEPLAVELHWSLVQANTSQMNIGVAWATSEQIDGYNNVRILSPSYTFYALCLHGASHQMDSLKYVMDVLHFLERHYEQIDFHWLLEQAKRDHTSRRIAAALSVVEALFPGLGNMELVPYERIRTRNYKSRLYRLTFTLSMLDSWRYRFIHIARLIIPSQSLALYSLGSDQRQRSWLNIYYNLYKQRLRKLFGGLREGV
jgi:hypothetical protein